jgi:hypothetical protein
MTSKPLPLPPDGYLRDWLVLGSFTGNTPRNMWTPFIREPTSRPSGESTEAKRRWRRLSSPDAVIDFMRDAPFLSQHSECCAYCHVYVHVLTARQVCCYRPDDGVAVWVNGRAFSFRGHARVCADENVVLQSCGWNRIPVMTQYGGRRLRFGCRRRAARRSPTRAGRSTTPREERPAARQAILLSLSA